MGVSRRMSVYLSRRMVSASFMSMQLAKSSMQNDSVEPCTCEHYVIAITVTARCMGTAFLHKAAERLVGNRVAACASAGRACICCSSMATRPAIFGFALTTARHATTAASGPVPNRRAARTGPPPPLAAVTRSIPARCCAYVAATSEPSVHAKTPMTPRYALAASRSASLLTLASPVICIHRMQHEHCDGWLICLQCWLAVALLQKPCMHSIGQAEDLLMRCLGATAQSAARVCQLTIVSKLAACEGRLRRTCSKL